MSLTSRDNEGPLFKVRWSPGSGSELNAGDRYRVTVTNGGRTLLAIDQRVDEYDVFKLLPPNCISTCLQKAFEFDDAGHCTNCDAAHTDAGN